MNQDERSSLVSAVLSVIGDVVDLRGQKATTRPVLVRFAWFCAGVVFVLAFRPASSGGPETSDA